jgi:hypothetical protein
MSNPQSRVYLEKPIILSYSIISTHFTENDCSLPYCSTVKPPRQTSPQAHADEQHKHHMNQMVVYKNQLGIPLMMGLWEPETCRVKIKEINTQNKQLHPLVTLVQYVQKMHGTNNLKFVHCHAHNSLSLVLNLSQIHLVEAIPPIWDPF